MLQGLFRKHLKCLDEEIHDSQEGDFFHFKEDGVFFQAYWMVSIPDIHIFNRELLLIKCAMEHPLNIK